MKKYTEEDRKYMKKYTFKRYNEDETFRRVVIERQKKYQRNKIKELGKEKRIRSLMGWITRLENKKDLTIWEKKLLKENKHEVKKSLKC